MAPLPSPEKSPAASYATGRRSSPVSLADARVLPVSVAAEAGAQRGPRRAGPRRVLGRGRRVLGRAGVLAGHCSVGPVQQLWMHFDSYLFALLFHRIVLLFKNM